MYNYDDLGFLFFLSFRFLPISDPSFDAGFAGDALVASPGSDTRRFLARLSSSLSSLLTDGRDVRRAADFFGSAVPDDLYMSSKRSILHPATRNMNIKLTVFCSC